MKVENITDVENKMLQVIKNKDVIIYKDSYITKQGLKEVIELWNKENNKNIDVNSALNSIINKIEAINC